MDVPYQARSRWLAAHVLPHEPAIRAWLARTTRASAEDIDDIIQETYAVLARLKSVDTIRDPRSYAFQVARSVFLQGLRRNKIVTIDAIADIAALEIVDEAPSPERHAMGKHELIRVETAIGKMPPQVRKVFWLRRVEGLSQRDTADVLGLAEHTVEKYSARGLKCLLSQFGRGGKSPAESSNEKTLKLVESDPRNAPSRESR